MTTRMSIAGALQYDPQQALVKMSETDVMGVRHHLVDPVLTGTVESDRDLPQNCRFGNSTASAPSLLRIRVGSP